VILNNLKYFYFVLLLVSTFTIVKAQVYYFKEYTTSDGLIQGTVRVISQDLFGRMWFGTAEGVSIYDGSSFYNFGAKEGLTFPVITSFLELTPGIMLAGSLGNGVIVFEKSDFRKDTIISILKDDKFVIGSSVNQISRDPDGNVWIYSDQGISEWIYKDGVLSVVKHQKELGQFGHLGIYRAEFTDDGDCYFATDIGLIKKHNNQYDLIFHNPIHKKEPVLWVYKDNDGKIWFPSLNRLYYLKDGKVFNFSELHPGVISPVITYERDKTGNLKFAHLGRIFSVNENRFEIMDDKNGLKGKNIISLFYDKEYNLWIGSLEGISKMSNTGIKYVKVSLSQNYITSGMVKIGNKLYIGTNTELFEINNFNLEPTDLSKGIGKASFNGIASFKSTLWFATDRGVFIKSKSELRHFTVSDGLPNNTIYSFSMDSSGIVWMPTHSGLAYYKDGKVFNFSNRMEKNWKFSDAECQTILSTISIRWLTAGRDSSVWVGSWDKGLFRIKNDSVLHFTQKDGLNDLYIRALFIDRRNNLWVGTRYSGVFVYENGKFSQISVKDGLSSNWVFSILEDDYGNYWFATANGLNKYNGREWLRIDASEGITSGEIKFSLKNGNELWFSSWNQIFCYQTENNNDSTRSEPGIYFVQVSSANGPIPEDTISRRSISSGIEKISRKNSPENRIAELTHNNNSIFFEFAGTSYRDETKVRYDYCLEGFDKKWNRSTKRNYATYTHLPPGMYKFKVYSINGEGIRSSRPAVFSFRILPPFWQTWWFITSAILVSLFLTSAITILLYRMRVAQKLKVERMRTKIATDLHDDIGTSLSSIAIFSQLAKRKIKSNENQTEEYLDRIEKTSRNLIDAMGDIVWSINPQNDSLEDAILKMEDYAVKLFEAKGIDVHISVSKEIENINLPIDIRRNLLLIFKEMVTNVAKHSAAANTNIEIKIDRSDGRDKLLIIKVEDNGTSFNINKNYSGSGLKNLKARTDSIGGELNISSSLQSGTVYLLSMKIK
jgi:ligand-binding sensor domain-containing protein/two-component sensor histidine kinase